MKRSEVRSFVESGVNLLNEEGTILQFDNGRITEFNSSRSNEYPFAWMEPLNTSPEIINSVPYDNWEVIIHIAQKDAPDSVQSQYESIVDSCDEIGQKLTKKFNDVVSGYKLVELLGVSRVPFYKKHADCLSGVILSLTIKAPDTTNLC